MSGDDVFCVNSPSVVRAGGPRCRPCLPLWCEEFVGGDAGYDVRDCSPRWSERCAMLLPLRHSEYQAFWCASKVTTSDRIFANTRSGWRGCRRRASRADKGALIRQEATDVPRLLARLPDDNRCVVVEDARAIITPEHSLERYPLYGWIIVKN